MKAKAAGERDSGKLELILKNGAVIGVLRAREGGAERAQVAAFVYELVLVHVDLIERRGYLPVQRGSQADVPSGRSGCHGPPSS